MKHLWAVASGEYSDYRVHAVFETKAQADAAALLNVPDSYNDYRVEEIQFYPKGTKAKMVTVYSLQVNLWDDGRWNRGNSNSSAEPSGALNPISRVQPEFNSWHADAGPRPKTRFVRAPCHNGKGGRFEVYGTNRSAVLKTVKDRVAEHTAVGATISR